MSRIRSLLERSQGSYQLSRSVNTWGRALQVPLAAVSFLLLAPAAAATPVPWVLLALYTVVAVPIALPFVRSPVNTLGTLRAARLGLTVDLLLFTYTLWLTGGINSALVIFPAVFLFRVGLEAESLRMYVIEGAAMLAIFSAVVLLSALATDPVPWPLLAFVLYQYFAAFAIPLFSVSRRVTLTATARTLEAVRAANSRLTGQLELSLVLNELISSAGDYVNADSAAIVLRGESGHVRVAASRGMSADDIAAVEALRNDDELFGRVFRGIVRNVGGDEFTRFHERYPFMRHWQSILACPLSVDSTVTGVLAVAADRDQAFTSQHREFVEAITAEAGTAMRNAMLHERTLAMSQQDDLTGLLNSRRLRIDLDERLALADGMGQPLSFLMLDLDFFKQFNDGMGHQAGDDALRTVGQAIRAAARPVDLAYRYGGEEFSILMPATGFQEAKEAAERVRDSVNERLSHVAGPNPLTVSIGVASFPEHAGTARELVDCADQALYAAKNAGRNRVIVFTPDLARPATTPADPIETASPPPSPSGQPN